MEPERNSSVASLTREHGYSALLAVDTNEASFSNTNSVAEDENSCSTHHEPSCVQGKKLRLAMRLLLDT